MNYYELSTPKFFDEEFNLDEEIKKANEYFTMNFINVDERRHINGDFIFVKNDLRSGMYERFLHSISMKDKEYYTMYPCNNDITYVGCTTNCEVGKSPEVFQRLNRSLCLYRLSRIFWLPEIIDLANENNSNIKIWRKEEQDKSNDKWRWKRFVRYNNGLADYILVFNEKYKNGKFNLLDFRTAYPVFIKRDKINFDKDYEKYMSVSKK